MKTIDINKLPINVKIQVREALTMYPKTYVEYENGQYRHVVGLALDTRVKAPDFTTYEFKNTDVYTPEQIRDYTAALPDFNW